jgi:hypothetical protein
MSFQEKVLILVLTEVATIVGNTISYKHPVGEAVIGYLILVAIIAVGLLIHRAVPRLPMVFWVSIVAIAVAAPISPLAKTIGYYTGKVDFLALCTPILAYAGLAVGKDLESFKKMSWRIIVVAVCVYTGTFLFATMIAEVLLRMQGVI